VQSHLRPATASASVMMYVRAVTLLLCSVCTAGASHQIKAIKHRLEALERTLDSELADEERTSCSSSFDDNSGLIDETKYNTCVGLTFCSVCFFKTGPPYESNFTCRKTCSGGQPFSGAFTDMKDKVDDTMCSHLPTAARASCKEKRAVNWASDVYQGNPNL